ncbi:MAG: 3-isopropylmalate dehydratase small subunit [Pseudomonadota bacterium]
MTKIERIESRTVVLPAADIDTDQIIPARFLTTTTRAGLGKHLFANWRYLEDGSDNPDFVLNTAQAQGCNILVAGDNFGCGSSREHAPWALRDFGFHAVISSSIADIFRSNAAKNGLVPVLVSDECHAWLLANPGAAVSIDVDACTVSLPTGSVESFPLDAFSRYCLLNGVDELGFLQQQMPAIESYEANR